MTQSTRIARNRRRLIQVVFRLLLITALILLTFPLHAQDQDDPPKLTATFYEASGEIALTDAEGEVLHILDGEHMSLYAERFSPNWRYYVSSDLFNFALLWDTWTGEQIAELVMDDVNRVNQIAFSPDETLIAVGGERGEVIRVFEIAALRRGVTEPVLRRQVIAGGAIGLTFNHDGTLLAATTYIDAASSGSLVLLWHVETGDLLLEEVLEVSVGSPRFVDDESRLQVTGEGVDYFFDIPTPVE